MKWTSEQLEAIDKDNTSIIVSAGAGSGKTAVLTERVIRKIKDGVNINELLILTFTNKAALEMKERIRKSLKKYPEFKSQLDLINEAYVITNNDRSLVGVSSLTLDSSLVEAASIRAKELSDSFSHTRPNGSSCFTVLSELGISYGTAGENIAVGYSSSQSVMEGWRSSSGHYQNIISSKFKKIGIGVNIINNQYYWVQIFSN